MKIKVTSVSVADQPAAMLYTDDFKGDYERIAARGAEFTMPPTDMTGSTSAMPNDTCDNRSRAVQNGSGQRGAGTKGRREVHAHSRQRTAPLAGKSLAGAYRPNASARVGSL